MLQPILVTNRSIGRLASTSVETEMAIGRGLLDRANFDIPEWGETISTHRFKFQE